MCVSVCVLGMYVCRYVRGASRVCIWEYVSVCGWVNVDVCFANVWEGV